MPKKSKPNNAAETPSFEEELERLEAIVHELEEGDVGLNEALARYEEGVKLLRRCHELLQRAERRIELLSGVDEAGNPVTRPLEDESEMSLEEKAAQRSRRRTAGGPSAMESPPEEGASDVDSPDGLF
jgi:exodeoxyribonuclease VII small subunit